MGITIDDVRHCLKVMVDCEVCEECRLYGTTGTDHCEHDCVIEALNYINKYQKMQADYENRLKADMVAMLEDLDLQIDESASYNREVAKVQRLIRDKINSLKEQTDGMV